jgi:hypothetical protein
LKESADYDIDDKATPVDVHVLDQYHHTKSKVDSADAACMAAMLHNTGPHMHQQVEPFPVELPVIQSCISIRHWWLLRAI